jgi:TatD DNase family protein
VLSDSHCHLDLLDLEALGTDLDGAVAAANAAGVGYLLCVSVDMESFPRVVGAAHRYAGVTASVGVHPNVKGKKEPSVQELAQLAATSEVVAVGETGLDYYRHRNDPEEQQQRFRRHIRAARLAGKPLIVHTREARADTLRILREERAQDVSGVLHCFTEDWATAEEAMGLGFYISLSGVVTFQNAEGLRDVAKRLPLERLLIETDAPYLAPVPHRGKTNQPAYVRHVAEHIAQVRSVDFDEVAEATTRNYLELFRPPQESGRRVA